MLTSRGAAIEDALEANIRQLSRFPKERPHHRPQPEVDRGLTRSVPIRDTRPGRGIGPAGLKGSESGAERCLTRPIQTDCLFTKTGVSLETL